MSDLVPGEVKSTSLAKVVLTLFVSGAVLGISSLLVSLVVDRGDDMRTDIDVWLAWAAPGAWCLAVALAVGNELVKAINGNRR